MYQQILVLHKVQGLDNSIEKIQKAIELLKNEPQLIKMKNYKIKFEEVWEETHSELLNSKKKLKAAELDLVEIAQHLQDLEAKIYNSKTTSKELEFFLKEKENKIEQGNDLESNIINLLEEIDHKESLHLKQKNILRDINKKIIELTKIINSNVEEKNKQIEKLNKEKQKQMTLLNDKFKIEYQKKRKKLRNQLVSFVTDNQICEGCHLKISNNIYKKVIEHSVVKCEGCGRYLISM